MGGASSCGVQALRFGKGSQDRCGRRARLRDLKDKAIKSPASVVNHPLDALWSLSSSHTNEPGKESRSLIGYDKDGTAEYARLAFDKIGEEVEGACRTPLIN